MLQKSLLKRICSTREVQPVQMQIMRERERERQRESSHFGSSREWFKESGGRACPPPLSPSLLFLPASPERLLYYLIVTCALFTERVRDGEIGKIGPVRDPTPRRVGDVCANCLTNIGVRSLGYDIAFRDNGHRGERDGAPQPYPCSVLLPQ